MTYVIRRILQNVIAYTRGRGLPARDVEITAGDVEKGVNRGILEIVAEGRPTRGRSQVDVSL